MKRFNRHVIVNDMIFEYENIDVQELLEKDDSVLADDVFNITTSYTIHRIAKSYSFNPAFLTLILLCLTDNLKRDENHSAEEILLSMGFPHIQRFDQKIDMICRLIYRMILQRNKTMTSREVKVMDDKPFNVKNYATFVLYNTLPWVGRKDFYVFKREVDDVGNIVKVWRELEKRAPFGVYLFRKKAMELGLEYLLVGGEKDV
jgi:hypothetical protein